MLEIAVPGMNQPSRLRLTYKGKMLKWGYGINNRRSVLNRMKGNGRHLLAVLLTVGMIIGNMSGAVYADEIQPSAASESVLETETSDTADEIVDLQPL